MRKALYLLFPMLAFGILDPASACQELIDPPYEDFNARASTVFVGHVSRIEEAETVREQDHLPPQPVVEATLRIVEVLKGKTPADGKVRAYAHIHCNINLLAGRDLAIFLYKDNFIRGINEGTTQLLRVESGGTKHLFGQLREERKESRERLIEEVRGFQQGEGERLLGPARPVIGRASGRQRFNCLCRSPCGGSGDRLGKQWRFELGN